MTPPPTYVVSVDGIDRVVKLGSMTSDKQASGLHTLEATLLDAAIDPGDPAPAWPEEGQEIIRTENGVRTFGGILTHVQTHGITLQDTDLEHELAASDFNLKAQRRYCSGIYPEQTVKARLQVIIADGYLDDVTLDAGQADGAVIPARTYNLTRIDDVLTETGQLGGNWVWKIDYFKVLSAFDPTTVPAPFDVVEGDGTTGLIAVEALLDGQYANNIILVCNGAGPADSTEYFTAADGVTVGGYIYFTTRYPAGQKIGDLWPNEFRWQDDGVGDFVNLGGIGRIGPDPDHDIPTGVWDWDVVNHRLQYTIASGGFFPSGADRIRVGYAIGFPFVVTSSDAGEIAAKGQVDFVVSNNTETTIEAAQAIADAELATRTGRLRRVSYPTTEIGLEPGQIQHVTSPQIGLDDDVLITGISERDAGHYLERDVVGIVGAQIRAKWQDIIRQAFQVGGGGSGPVDVTGGVQPGGDDDALYDAGNSGTSKTIDWSNGKAQKLLLTGNVTLTMVNPRRGGRYVLILKQDGTGGRTVTWPAAVKWDNDNTPWMSALAAAGVLTTFMYDDDLTKYIGAWNSPYSL